MMVMREMVMDAVLNVRFKMVTYVKKHPQYAIYFLCLVQTKIALIFKQRISRNQTKITNLLPTILKFMAPSKPITTKSSSRWTL